MGCTAYSNKQPRASPNRSALAKVKFRLACFTQSKTAAGIGLGRANHSWRSAVIESRQLSRAILPWLAGVAFFMGAPATLLAQTDYYNTDAGRPITVEDAYPTERYAFELQLAPLKLERSEAGVYSFAVEPEIAYGILPRTHLEVGVPMVYVDRGTSGKRAGAAGLDISVLHNLNAETSIPALGIAGELLLPVGGLAHENTYFSAKGIATRTLQIARFHFNGRYTFGDSPELSTLPSPGQSPKVGAEELSRWLLGVAVDKTFPLRTMLVTAETFVTQPMDEDEDAEWNVGAGVRYQLNPQFAMDGGLGKKITGNDRGWFVTFGLARAFGVRSLFPVR